MERRADVPGVVGEKGRLLRQLSEVRVTPAGVDANVSEVAGDDGQRGLTRESRLVDYAGEPDVVDPYLERVRRQNRIRSRADGKPQHPDSELLHGGEVRRTHSRVERVDHVAVTARGVARARGRAGRQRRVLDQHRIQASAGVALLALQICVLNLGPEREQLVEAYDDLRSPRLLRRSRVYRRAVHVEVVSVARDLDVELELAIDAPTAAHPSRPQPQLSVAHEILFAFREPVVRFGAIERREVGGDQPQRALVDLYAPGLVGDGLARRCVGHSGRRLVGNAVANVLVLRTDYAGLDGADAGLIVSDSVQRPVAHLEPRGARESQSRQRNGVERVVRAAIARDHRDAKSAGPPQQRLTERVIGRAKRNSKENPADIVTRAARLAG